MRADITRTAGSSGLGRVQTPFDMIGFGNGLRCHPVLHELDMDLIDPTNAALFHNFPCLTDHGKTGHGVTDRKDETCVPGNRDEFIRLTARASSGRVAGWSRNAAETTIGGRGDRPAVTSSLKSAAMREPTDANSSLNRSARARCSAALLSEVECAEAEGTR